VQVRQGAERLESSELLCSGRCLPPQQAQFVSFACTLPRIFIPPAYILTRRRNRRSSGDAVLARQAQLAAGVSVGLPAGKEVGAPHAPGQADTGINAAANQYRLCLFPSGPRPMARSKPTTSSSSSAAGLTHNLSTTS
jgi:hypothetical protein